MKTHWTKFFAVSALLAVLFLGYLGLSAVRGILHRPDRFITRFEPYKAPLSDVLSEVDTEVIPAEIVAYRPTQREIEAIEDDLRMEIPDRLTGIHHIDCGPAGTATIVTHLESVGNDLSEVAVDVSPDEVPFFRKGDGGYLNLFVGTFDFSTGYSIEYERSLFYTGRVEWVGKAGYMSTLIVSPLTPDSRRIDTPYVFVGMRIPLHD